MGAPSCIVFYISPHFLMISCWTSRARTCWEDLCWTFTCDRDERRKKTDPSFKPTVPNGHGGAGDSGGKLRKKTWERYGTVVLFLLEEILWSGKAGDFFSDVWGVGIPYPARVLPGWWFWSSKSAWVWSMQLGCDNSVDAVLGGAMTAMSLARGWQQLRIRSDKGFCRFPRNL